MYAQVPGEVNVLHSLQELEAAVSPCMASRALAQHRHVKQRSATVNECRLQYFSVNLIERVSSLARTFVRLASNGGDSAVSNLVRARIGQGNNYTHVGSAELEFINGLYERGCSVYIAHQQ
jgi:hypothetical protein